jgi:DNA-directed RNA polymerase specialized sigma24 family protein
MPQLNARLAATDANTSPTTPPSDDGRPPLADAYLRHRAWLTALLARRYGPDEAADIAQDTWLRVHRYEPPPPIRSPKFSSRSIGGGQEQALFFEQMMLALPPKLRDVFALNHVRGLTYREIAQLRGISVKAVEKRMTQAIARCADMIRG